MISFIVIGRNEGAKLTKCLESISETIKYNQLNNYEVIYVDSKSSDNSIGRAKKFAEIKIFQITGIYNAAIARNIGAVESKGDILFFIDGDMEIEPAFLKEGINSKGELIHDCITGHLDDLFYDVNDSFLCRYPRTYKISIPKIDQVLTTNGGIFILKRKYWVLVNGMKTKFKRSQDIDLTIRLANSGIKTIRIPFLIAKHHTIDYQNDKKIWDFIFAGKEFYPALLFKTHILNYKVVIHTLRSHYTSFLFLFLLSAVFISKKLIIVSCILYISFLLLKVFFSTINAATSKNKILYFIERVIFQTLRDIVFWFAILFFCPSEKKAKYIQVV